MHVEDTAGRPPRRAHAEDAGFDIFQVGDHVGAEPSALICLAAAAVATERIRLGTLVLNNGLHHPVPLAQEVATLDQLSNGRLEVGLGAGHSFTEYAAMVNPSTHQRNAKERLAESIEILRALLDGTPVSRRGAHYRVDEAVTLAPRQEDVPLLVGVNGRTALAHAVRHADIVAPTMLGRTRGDGQHHDVRWEASRLDATVEWMRHEAGERWDGIELHALVQAVVITDDRARVASEAAGRIGMDVADAACTPFLCIGTHAEIARHLLACRERWGFSYFSVRDMDAFTPVLSRLR